MIDGQTQLVGVIGSVGYFDLEFRRCFACFEWLSYKVIWKFNFKAVMAALVGFSFDHLEVLVGNVEL